MADKKTFDLASIIGEVSNPDTSAGGLLQIDIDLLDADARNFYALADIDALAANIELIGLQQPLRVRAGENGRYTIVSGHRRCAALRQLVAEGKTEYCTVPCLLDAAAGSEAMQELRLIYANSDTRKMTSADISMQAERVEALLYQLKSEGVEFPGKMRAHVAEACKISESKLARLKVIRENLMDKYKPAWESGKLSEAIAYALAQYPVLRQATITSYLDNRMDYWAEWKVREVSESIDRIAKIKCQQGGTCDYSAGKLEKRYHMSDGWNCCDNCCATCYNFAKCKMACPRLAEKQKAVKADAKEAARQAAAAKAAEEQPDIELLQNLWLRYGLARTEARRSIKDTRQAMDNKYYGSDESQRAKEAGTEKFTANDYTPYKYARLCDLRALLAAADYLGCTTDYLLFRTGERTASPAAQPPAEGWIPLQWIPGSDRPKNAMWAVCKFCIDDVSLTQKAYWQFDRWAFSQGGAPIEAECVSWFPIPEDDDKNNEEDGND